MTKEIIFLLSPLHAFRRGANLFLFPTTFQESGGARFRRAQISALGRSGLDGVSPHRSSNHELRFMNRTEAMLAEQFHEFREAALFVGAKVVVNVPAEVILSEIVVVFDTAADDGIERVQAEASRFAQLPAQAAVVHATAQGPDGINEGQLRQVIPSGAQVPDFVLARGT